MREIRLVCTLWYLDHHATAQEKGEWGEKKGNTHDG